MRKIMSFGIAAILTLVAVAAWSKTRTHSDIHAKVSAASSSQIDPFELMSRSTGLIHQQYDAH
jgi:hypothetical protein